jgi:aquaporin Z
MMSMVLVVSNRTRIAHFTGIGAGLLVAAFIVFESPFSGMSMNPARTLGPNVLADATRTLWIYFGAPPLGMLLAAELYFRRHGPSRVRCAKLHHTADARCIFRCGYADPGGSFVRDTDPGGSFVRDADPGGSFSPNANPVIDPVGSAPIRV